MKEVTQRARNNKQTTIKIEFGSLVGFAMSGEGVDSKFRYVYIHSKCV
jgi:hypothetical protein